MPFPRVKGNVYEYSNHMPLAVMWPDGIKKPGRKADDYVSFIDFAPTFLELAGITPQDAGMKPVTGTSLTDIFYSEKEGTVNPKRDFVLLCMERHDVGRPMDVGYPVRGLISDGYLYLFNFKPDRWPACNPETGYLNCDGSPTKTFILNDRRAKGNQYFWQLNFGKRPQEELYNISDDPFCMKNLAERKEYNGLKLKLYGEMIQRLTEQQDPRISGNGDVFDRYEYAGEVKGYYERYLRGEIGPANWVEKSDYEPEWIGEK
jgi:arylsulfatase A-like enzyme